VMGSVKTLLMLITVAWISLLVVLVTISTVILPLVHGIESNVFAGLARLGLSFLLFAIWLVWIFELALFTLFKHTRRGREGSG